MEDPQAEVIRAKDRIREEVRRVGRVVRFI
jgi:hypothetical protein